jgi:tetratricopeptide (TPR) repeat protein
MAATDHPAPAGAVEPLASPAATVDRPGAPLLPLVSCPNNPGSSPAPRQPGAVLGWLAVVLVLLFAFLASSFAVRNSDFWHHLALGRLLARGDYSFGADPFGFTAQGVYWVNHSWLFDLLLYGIHQTVGGAGLVVLKAFLVTGLAGLMLSVRRAGGVAVPLACTALALLAMSPRLLLQPVCVSLFCLGLTFWLLWRPVPSGGAFKRFVPLLALFALWVNLDAWFVLGPLLVGLAWLGSTLEGRIRGSIPVRYPTWLLPASLLVCLLNPHHLHALALPAELTLDPTAGLRDVRFNRLFGSPWQSGVRLWPAAAINLAECAYFVLVGLGLLAFILNRRQLSGRRLAVWLGFGLLPAWQLRAVPFFAVVAGPLTALELQDFLLARGRTDQRRLGQLILVPVLLALVVLAWGGWLQGFAGEGRRVAWSVQPDPSLHRVAETLSRWRQEGRLPRDAHGFHFHPDVAHYCAWFCPREKTFLDHRFLLFRGVMPEYRQVCLSLNPDLDASGEKKDVSPTEGCREVFRRHGITHLVLYDPDLRRMLPALSRLLQDGRHWPLLAIDGQAVVFAWDEEGRGEAGQTPYDADRLVFAPHDGDERLGAQPAPRRGPGRGPEPRTPWDRLAHADRPSTWESAAATLYLRCFADGNLQKKQAEPPSPALPLLTVRAARRALAANPDDANAYLRLGQAYLALDAMTPGTGTARRLPPLAMLRHVQTVTALEQALIREPDIEAAHQALGQLYARQNYLDLALLHRQAELRLTRRAGHRPGEGDEAFRRRTDDLGRMVEELERTVQDRQNLFVIRATPLGDDPLGKARLALSLGLARQALDDVLLRSQALLFGTAGAELEVRLLLMQGRLAEARPKLEDDEFQRNKSRLGWVYLPAGDGPSPPPYRVPAGDWLFFCQAAAAGDYDQAEAVLQTILDALPAPTDRDQTSLAKELGLALASEVGLRAEPRSLLGRSLASLKREELTRWWRLMSLRRVVQADLRVTAGLLALERGQPPAAADHFRRALELYRAGDKNQEDFGGQALALDYLERLPKP